MTVYLLDTNVLSEMMRERPAPIVERRLARHKEACAIPAPVIDELQFGISSMAAAGRRALYQQWLESLLANFPVLPFDELCGQWHGRERARLMRIGKTPALFDGLIASIAAVSELTLVTRNTADFAQFDGLRMENWFES